MFRLDGSVDAEIRAHARRELPNEACGYLSGLTTLYADGVHPLRNVDASPEHFAFEPKEQFDVLKRVRGAGKRLIGVYHSHPETPARMSEEDLQLLRDPSMIYVIYSVTDDRLNAFRLEDGVMLQIDVEAASAETARK